MSNVWVFDIYPPQKRIWGFNRILEDFEAKEHNEYYVVKADDERDIKYLERYLKKKKIKYRKTKEEWNRSSNYRNQFFKYYKAPYRCRYCNKQLEKKTLQVDHLIPIAKVKKSMNARSLMYLAGIENVNDIENLVPSCARCNRKKRDKLGIWYIKGVLGKYKWYWIISYTLKVLIALAIIVLGIYLYKNGLPDISLEKIIFSLILEKDKYM